MGKNVLGFAATLGLLAAAPASAQLVPRQAPISGQVIGTKTGETAVLVPSAQSRQVEIRQQLKAGDVLRTNASGTLAR